MSTIKRVISRICGIYYQDNAFLKDLLLSSSLKDIVDILCNIVDNEDISPLIALLEMLVQHNDCLAECIAKLKQHQEIVQPVPLSKECSSPPKSPVSYLFLVDYEHRERTQTLLHLSEECSSPPNSPVGSPEGSLFVGYDANNGTRIYHSTAQVPLPSPEEPPGISSETSP